MHRLGISNYHPNSLE